jgi:predicted PurR-regulated permease PerM
MTACFTVNQYGYEIRLYAILDNNVDEDEMKRGWDTVTRKLWFQVSIGILLVLFIIKYVVEVNWIFSPIVVVLETIFIPLLISGVLFYISLPLQTFLEKNKVPRWGSIIIIFLMIIAFIWAAIGVVGPPISKQVNNLVENAPTIVEDSTDVVLGLLDQADTLPKWANDYIQKAKDNIPTTIETVTAKAGKWIVSIFQSIIQGTLILVLVPFFLVFMLKDHEKFIPFIIQFFGGKTKEWIEKTFTDVNEVLSLYIRGQVLISTILALLLFIGYLSIGLNFALLLAVFAFFMNIIPFIGPWIAFIPALVIGFFQDPILVIWISLITLAANQIDSNLITPNVMGKTLNIHPITVITILLAAGSLAGFFGILLAVPGYAVGKAIISNIYAYRQDIKKSANKTV